MRLRVRYELKRAKSFGCELKCLRRRPKANAYCGSRSSPLRPQSGREKGAEFRGSTDKFRRYAPSQCPDRWSYRSPIAPACRTWCRAAVLDRPETGWCKWAVSATGRDMQIDDRNYLE